MILMFPLADWHTEYNFECKMIGGCLDKNIA